MISCACPQCAREFELSDALAGSPVICRSCRHAFAVPTPVVDWLPGPLADIAEDFRLWLQADPRRQWGLVVVLAVVGIAGLGYWNAQRPQPLPQEPDVDLVYEQVSPAKRPQRRFRPLGRKNGPKTRPQQSTSSDRPPVVARKPRWNQARQPTVQVVREKPFPTPPDGIWRLEREAWQNTQYVAGSTPDGRYLAYHIDKLTVKVVNTETMQVIARLTFPQETNTFAPSALLFSPDGRTLAIIRREYVGTRIGIQRSRLASVAVWLYDTQTWQKRGLLSGPRDHWDRFTSYIRNASAWAFSGDSQRIAVAYGSDIRVHDATTGRLLNAWKAGKAVVTAVAFAGTDRRLVSGDEKGMLQITNLVTRETETAIPLHTEIRRLSVTPNELLVVDLDNRLKHSVGLQLQQGRLVRTLWMKPGVSLATDGKRFASRETVGAARGRAPAIVLYDAEKSFAWRDLFPAPHRIGGNLMFVGRHLVSISGYGQILVVHPEERLAVAVGELRLPEKPVPTAPANVGNLGFTYNAGSTPRIRRVVRLWPVGERFVLAAHNDGRVDLIDLAVATQWAQDHRPSRVAVADSAPRAWTDRQKRRLTARVAAVTDGILELEVNGKSTTRKVPFLELSLSDQDKLAGSHLAAEVRVWRPIGAGPIKGRALRYRPPYLDIETPNGKIVTVPVVRVLRDEQRYVKWLRSCARSRFLPMVQHLDAPPAGRVARAKAAEADLQGVWQVVRGLPERMPPEDRFVYVVGNELFVPIFISRQKTQWARQRYCVMTDVKPHKRIDRFGGANSFRGSIYQLQGDTLRLQLGLGPFVPDRFQSTAWILKRVRKSITFDEATRITSRYQEPPQ